jgi:eukaryotic-like serine/threonine-protein kinase
MHAVTGTGRLIAGRYRLQGPIGRGAMGIVWRGRDELLARDVAVKEVQITAHASPADAEAIYQRTLREARTAARLAHPGVVTVFDVVEESGSPWIIMELVEARSLDRVITEDGPLPPLEAAELGSDLISALASAHSAGVLHRDVKPSNVLVTTEGKAVLTDFGIATFAEDPAMTQAGMVVGTPGFTAPERVRGDSATPAADLWSLGATLFAAVEGRGPFDRHGGSTAITAGVATEKAPRAPSAGPLGPVIDALLSRDPAGRPDAATAARLLAEAATAARTGARPLGDGWLAAEASTAEVRSRADDSDADASQPGIEAAAVAQAARAGDSALPGGSAVAGDAAVAGPADQDDAARSGATQPGAGRHAGSSAPGEASTAGQQRAAFLDPPVFAELSMPEMTGPAGDPEAVGTVGGAAPAVLGADGGPVLWQPMKPGSGETPGSGPAGSSFQPGAGGPGGDGGAGGPSGPGGGSGGVRFWRRNGPPGPSSGRWRLMVAGAGVAAIVIAAVIGWSIYTHTQTSSALHNLTPPAIGPGGSSPASGQAGGSGSSHRHGTTPSAGSSPGPSASHGHTPAAGNPSITPSGKPSGHSGSPGTSPSPSASPSPTPTPTPTPTPSPSPTVAPRVLPKGWLWHKFPEALTGTAAGFKIGLPSPWTQSYSGLVAHLNQPAKGFHLNVNLGLWTYVKPLAEARLLQKQYAATYNGYKKIFVTSVGFATIGGFRAAPAAELKFSWQPLTGGTSTELVVLVTLGTKSGSQPYAFHLWAPSSTFGSASGVFHGAIKTFRPLPAT